MVKKFSPTLEIIFRGVTANGSIIESKDEKDVESLSSAFVAITFLSTQNKTNVFFATFYETNEKYIGGFSPPVLSGRVVSRGILEYTTTFHVKYDFISKIK